MTEDEYKEYKWDLIQKQIQELILYNSIMEKLAKRYNTKVIHGLDINGLYYIYIRDIDKLKKRKYLYPLEGRSIDLLIVYKNYLRNLMNPQYQIRYKRKLYATTPLRNIVKSELGKDIETLGIK